MYDYRRAIDITEGDVILVTGRPALVARAYRSTAILASHSVRLDVVDETGAHQADPVMLRPTDWVALAPTA